MINIRFIIYYLYLLLIVVNSAYACTEHGPRLRIDNYHVDLGVIDTTVLESASIEHIFQITNDGEGLLQINKIELTCSCLSYKIPKVSLSSKETTYLTINIRVEQGNYKRVEAYIDSNDLTQPTQEVSITYDAILYSRVDPQSLFFNTGATAVDERTKEFTITLLNEGSTPIFPQKIDFNDLLFEIKLVGFRDEVINFTHKDSGFRQYRIFTFSVSPKSSLTNRGVFEEPVHVYFQNDLVLGISITLTNEPRIRVIPKTVIISEKNKKVDVSIISKTDIRLCLENRENDESPNRRLDCGIVHQGPFNPTIHYTIHEKNKKKVIIEFYVDSIPVEIKMEKLCYIVFLDSGEKEQIEIPVQYISVQ